MEQEERVDRFIELQNLSGPIYYGGAMKGDGIAKTQDYCNKQPGGGLFDTQQLDLER